MTISPASATLEASFGVAAAQFVAMCTSFAKDATALYNIVYGLDDGNDYGRFFFGQDPLVPYASSASSLDGLVSQGIALLVAVEAAGAALLAAQTDIPSFYAAGSALTEALRAACANPSDAVQLLTRLIEWQVLVSGNVVANDPLGAEISLLTQRAAHSLRLAAAASLVRATSDYVPTSRLDAKRVRDQVAGLLDDLALYAADIFDDATAEALQAARGAVVEDMNGRGGVLPSAVELQLGATVPALALAYRLYDDVTREDDLLARNPAAADPGFMPLIIEALTA